MSTQTAHVTVSYLAVTAVFITVFGRASPRWPWLVIGHLALASTLVIWQRRGSRPRVSQVLLDWHPILLFPLLYKEVEFLARAVGDWRLTAAIPALEARLFAGQPSMYLSEWLPSVGLSEFLHFCYLSHVVLIPAVATYWYTTGRRTAFHELAFLLACVMFGSYLFFILFPVDSPYYLSESIGPPLAGNFFFDLVHEVSSRGGARGGAFPSAHASGAVVVGLVAMRYQPRLACLLAPIILGVFVATVYGRFHYAVDTAAGLALGVAAVGVYRRMPGATAQPLRDDTP